jgi:hypothetical protein
MLTNKDVTLLMDSFKEVFATKEDLERLKQETLTKLDHIAGMLNKMIEDFEIHYGGVHHDLDKILSDDEVRLTQLENS